MDEELIRADTLRWIDRFVVGLELCPFAKRSIDAGRLRIEVSDATEPARLVESLEVELGILAASGGSESSHSLESTLLVHPNVLKDFRDFNDFLDVADATLVRQSLEGKIQIASFHPDYQFEATEPDDLGNYTNRSPFPMLHLIREEAVSRAIAEYPDPEGIPTRNVALLESLGRNAILALLRR